ncbi:MAG: zf-HC2 domain-containing protein [Armatimonadetes bacterium]|nr:zf-HC2 domain-containing protein [Armatimonadota bacterium]MDW8154817.1 zf-HC2 domain-containing protein [Armatimonadota bacterium]
MRHPEDLLSAYADGVLPVEEATRIAAHLAACASCLQVVEDLLAVRALLRRVPQPHPRPESLAHALRRLEERGTQRDRARRLLLAFLTACAAALLLYLPPPFASSRLERTAYLRHHARITLTHPMVDGALNAFLAGLLPQLPPEEP